MRLNPDCVRDILLYCEEVCTPDKDAVFHSETPFVFDGRTYEHTETLYHLEQCKMNGYFFNAKHDSLGYFCVVDITPKAHEFLENIRSNKIWGTVKTIAGEVGASSLSAITQIAAKVVSEVIIAYLRTNGMPI